MIKEHGARAYRMSFPCILLRPCFLVKACSKKSPLRFNRWALYRSSLSFCLCQASFANSFSRIVHYAPSIPNSSSEPVEISFVC